MHDGHRYGYAPRLVLDEAAGATIPSAAVNEGPAAVNAAPSTTAAVNAGPTPTAAATTAVNAGPTATTATTTTAAATTAVNRAGFAGSVAARIHRVPELVRHTFYSARLLWLLYLLWHPPRAGAGMCYLLWLCYLLWYYYGCYTYYGIRRVPELVHATY